MNFIVYLVFRIFAFIISFIPFSVLYGLSYLVYLLLYRLIGYRKKVTLSNLRKAFPTKSEKEIKTLARKFYRHLANVFLESIKGYSMSHKEIVKRHKIINPELLNAYFKKNKDVVVVTGHLGNWEWGSLSGGLQLMHDHIVFYQPLTNRYLDQYLQKSREKCNTTLIRNDKPLQAFRRDSKKPKVLVMVADQSPTMLIYAYWFDFFGISTAFIHGPERIARMHNLPVVYADFKLVKQGYYEVELISLVEDPSKLADGEITEIFSKVLEKKIREHPEYWVWSHRRWKRTKKDIRYHDYKRYKRDYREKE